MKQCKDPLIIFLNPPRCKICGEMLTSPRAIKWQEGQRCRWARMEAEGTRVYRKKKGPHMKEDVPFTSWGKRDFVQMKLGDFY